MPAGSGTADDPFQIASLENLHWLSQESTAWVAGTFFIQTEDIDASPTREWSGGLGFLPIARADAPFLGTYHGHGHVIDGLFINRPSSNHVGLFGVLGAGGSLDSIGLENGSIIGGDTTGALLGSGQGEMVRDCYATGYVGGHDEVGGLVGVGSWIENCHAFAQVVGVENVGGLVGRSQAGAKLRQCHSAGSVSANLSYGGLVGFGWHATIQRCYSTDSVTGRDAAGGLIGTSMYDTIQFCSAGGSVNARAYYAGGLIGDAFASQIMDSYATGNATGSFQVGGLLGNMDRGVLVRRCYASGSAVSTEYAGGLVGYFDSRAYRPAVIDSSYWNTESGGTIYGLTFAPTSDKAFPTVVSIRGLTDTQMKTQAAFDGWDFTKIWMIEEGLTYPKLRTDFADPGQVTQAGRTRRATFPEGMYAVEVTDIRGARVWSGDARWTGRHWNLPRLGAGAWVVHARTSEGMITQRLVQVAQ